MRLWWARAIHPKDVFKFSDDRDFSPGRGGAKCVDTLVISRANSYYVFVRSSASGFCGEQRAGDVEGKTAYQQLECAGAAL